MIGVFLDTETSGLNPKVHALLELAYQIVDLATGEIKDRYQSIIAPSPEVWANSDSNSLKVNGFTWDEVALGASSTDVKQAVMAAFSHWGVQRKKAVFICQNPSFDRVFFSQLIDTDVQEALYWPYHWLDLASMHWAVALHRAVQEKTPLPWEIGCSKDQIAAYYRLPAEEKPHRAMNGVRHLLLCYQTVVGFPQEVVNKGS